MLKDLITTLVPRIMGTYGKQRLSTLIYHRVLPAKDSMRPYEVTADQFEWQMRLISKYFSPVSIDEGLKCLEDGTLPERAICVTFDDGYTDNLTTALPILEKYNIPATVFVATGYLNGGRMWNDSVIEVFRRLEGGRIDLSALGLKNYDLIGQDERYFSALDVLNDIKYLSPSERESIVAALSKLVDALPEDLMLTDDQVLELHRRGVTIGAHTCSHPILNNVSEDESKQEIHRSKRYLEQLLGEEVLYFAYPNGKPGVDFSETHMHQVRSAGYVAAFSTEAGVSSRDTQQLSLRRYTPWQRNRFRFLLGLLSNVKNGD